MNTRTAQASRGLGFRDLTPDQVLDALAALGLHGDGRLLQLNSYENRVFQVHLEDGTVVVPKFYRSGRWSDAQLLEEHSFAIALAQAEVPVVAPLVLSAADHGPLAGSLSLRGEPPTLAVSTLEGTNMRLAVAPRCTGREPELDQAGVLEQIGRFLGRLHAVGAKQPFAHRHHLNPQADAQRAIDTLLTGQFVASNLQSRWQAVATQATELIQAAFASAALHSPLRMIRLHGDCHIGNILWRHEAREGQPPGPHLVDLDDAFQGPAVQDLWMLASSDAASRQRRLHALLEGYEQFAHFDWAQVRLIEPLRTLRMLRHSAWLAERWSDPAFPINFPFFGQESYWSQQIAQLQEQCELMAGTNE